MFQWRPIGAIDETPGFEVGGEVVGLERAGDGGVELVDE